MQNRSTLLCMMSVFLVLLLLAGCSTMSAVPSNGEIGLTKKEEALLKTSFYEYHAEKDDWIKTNCNADKVSVTYYYGKYNGAYVVSITMTGLQYLFDSPVTIEDITFLSDLSSQIMVYDETTWMNLKTAYENGRLTREDILAIAECSNAMYKAQLQALESLAQAAQDKRESEENEKLSVIKKIYFQRYIEDGVGTIFPQMTADDLHVISTCYDRIYTAAVIWSEEFAAVYGWEVSGNHIILYHEQTGDMCTYSEAINQGISLSEKMTARLPRVLEYSRLKLKYYSSFAKAEFPNATLENLEFEEVETDFYIPYLEEEPLGVNNPPKLEDVWYFLYSGDLLSFEEALNAGLIDEETLESLQKKILRIGSRES